MHIVVENISGNTTQYEVTDNPKIYIDGNDLKIQIGKDFTVIHPMDHVQKFYYKTTEEGGANITCVEKSENSIRYTDDGNLHIYSPVDAVGKIYTLDGVVINSFEVQSQQETTVSLTHLSSGAYIVSINSETIKILKK